MSNRVKLLILAFTALFIMFLLFSRKSSNMKSDGFSVPSQRVNSGKSAAITKKWDGIGKIADMIWE